MPVGPKALHVPDIARTLGQHPGHRDRIAVKDPHDVGVNDFLKVRDRVLLKRLARQGDPCIVHPNINSTESSNRVIPDCLNLVAIGDVARLGSQVSRGSTQSFKTFGRGGLTRSSEGDSTTSLDELTN